ncbi:trafficking protein particle complex subunit 2-like [Dysidea avara]|uniref:trafficking protein particle complex subunit 2-like n=1 Tax=Dysidea avara TaxID=196820 RepID=UPI00331B18B5
MAVVCYFVIVGHNDHPVFEIDLSKSSESQAAKQEDKRHLNQFIVHAALDLVDEMKWQSSNLYLKTVDRFNELTINAFVTASQMRFMLLHDNLRATDDAIKLFFMEVYELFIKAELNPFYVPNTTIKSQNFRYRATAVAKKHLL